MLSHPTLRRGRFFDKARMQAGRKPVLVSSRRYIVGHPTRAFYGRCTTHEQIRFASNVIPRTYCGNMPAGIGWSNIGKQRICTNKHRLLTANPPWRAKPNGQKKPTPERVAEWAFCSNTHHRCMRYILGLDFTCVWCYSNPCDRYLQPHHHHRQSHTSRSRSALPS